MAWNILLLLATVSVAAALGLVLLFSGLGEPEHEAIDGGSMVAFSELGWSEDVVVSGSSAPAKVRFELPHGAAQGDPIWYGVRLRFQWLGNPGSPGSYAFLYGSWNSEAVYQFKTKRLTDLDDGFHWSMVDMVKGGSHGYETTSSIGVSSTNFAQIGAIKEGWNEVTISLGLRDATNENIRVIVSKESEIIATSWEPTSFDWSATVDNNGDTLDLRVEGENLGWQAHDLVATALVWRDIGTGYDRESYSWPLGSLQPMASFGVDRAISNGGKEKVYRIDVELEWGAGRDFITAWPPVVDTPKPSLFNNSIFRSTIGILVSVVVLWVGIPALVYSVRHRKWG